MAALKDMFDSTLIGQLASLIHAQEKKFKSTAFCNDVLKAFPQMELNERMRHTSEMLHCHLPGPYAKNIAIFKAVIPHMPRSYTNLVFPDYVSQFGMKETELSLDALHYFTRFGSSEFAIRHFLRENIKSTIAVMKKWTKDENEHVRRLASEGSRPRLPWSFNLTEVINDPNLTLPILNNLIYDDSAYVRKSVANHLNDISKDHREVMVSFVKNHLGKNTETDKLLKHACRTLLKSGDSEVMALFGTAHSEDLLLDHFVLHSKKVHVGGDLQFTFQISNKGKSELKGRFEFAIYFLLGRGQYYRKVFKITERLIPANSNTKINKTFSFRPISTRQYRPGLHQLGIIVNGLELHTADFTLLP